MRTKCNRMDLIRNLNLWGNDLCQIAALRLMPNLEVLSLSVNRIESLADLRFCPKLTELYLRKNSISDLREVRHLHGLRSLKVLWLSDNPCATLPDYRAYVLQWLPGLVKLDSTDVTDEERRQAARANFDQTPMCVNMRTEQDMDIAGRSEVQGRLRDDREIGTQPMAARRYSASPEIQDEASRERRMSSGSVGRWPSSGFEDQHSVPSDPFHLHAGQPYSGHESGASPSDMVYDDHSPTPEVTPRNGPLDSSVRDGYSGDSYAGERRRSLGQPGDGNVGQPRSAWMSSDCPETPARSSHGYSGEHLGPPDEHYTMHGGDLQAEADEDVDAQMDGRAVRADNILCAVLALIKELDQQGLELVRRAIEHRQQSEH